MQRSAAVGRHLVCARAAGLPASAALKLNGLPSLSFARVSLLALLFLVHANLSEAIEHILSDDTPGNLRCALTAFHGGCRYCHHDLTANLAQIFSQKESMSFLILF